MPQNTVKLAESGIAGDRKFLLETFLHYAK